MKLLLITLVFAATVAAAACDPLVSTCPSNPAIAGSLTVDLSLPNPYFSGTDGSTIDYPSNGTSTTTISGSGGSGGSGGTTGNSSPALQMSLGTAKTKSILSDKYIMFGRIDVTLMAASDSTVDTFFQIKSDVLDLMSFRFVGGNDSYVQTNWTSLGDGATVDNSMEHKMLSSNSDLFHTYSLEYTPDRITFYIDGLVVRNVLAKDVTRLPQTPMNVMCGIYRFDQAYIPGKRAYRFKRGSSGAMKLKSIGLNNFSTGSLYSYVGGSTSWNSIQPAGGVLSTFNPPAGWSGKGASGNNPAGSYSMISTSSISSTASPVLTTTFTDTTTATETSTNTLSISITTTAHKTTTSRSGGEVPNICGSLTLGGAVLAIAATFSYII